MTPEMDGLCVFAVKRGNIEKRFDVRYNKPRIKTEDGYNRVSLGSLCLVEPDYGMSATAIERTDESQPKYIRITDFSDNGIEKNHTFTTVSEYLPKHVLNHNDILFARSGATVGKTYQHDETLGLAVFAGYCIRFIIDPKKALPKFVYWYTKTQLFADWVQKHQRPSGQPNINKEEYKSLEMILPSHDKQLKLVNDMDKTFKKMSIKLCEVNDLLASIDSIIFNKLGIKLKALNSSLTYALKLADILNEEIYCRPTYPDYLQIIHALQNSRWYQGNLEKYVSINPSTNYSELCDNETVSFVPMTAVGNKDNTVSYEKRILNDVKTGYTVFQCDDLLWAKITPCMQNGKSCLVTDMPTKIGFGSTEFHVLRRLSDKVYMPYIWALLSNSIVLQAAQSVFNGSAGQQRISDSFLKRFPLPLPDISTQKTIADNVFAMLEKMHQLKREVESDWRKAKELFERKLMGDY